MTLLMPFRITELIALDDERLASHSIRDGAPCLLVLRATHLHCTEPSEPSVKLSELIEYLQEQLAVCYPDDFVFSWRGSGSQLRLCTVSVLPFIDHNLPSKLRQFYINVTTGIPSRPLKFGNRNPHGVGYLNLDYASQPQLPNWKHPSSYPINPDGQPNLPPHQLL